MAHPLINIAIMAARKAGSIIVRAVDRLESVKISPKANNSFVTDIDTLAEKTMTDMIHKAYPSHNILAEESGQQDRKSDYTWIIDPLDGTTNFIHGLPHFAISIAIQYKNHIEHGVIYDPLRQELFSASRGQGAKLNQYRIRVSPCQQINQALLGTSFPHEDSISTQPNLYLKQFQSLRQSAKGMRQTGSAVLDLAYVACARLDGFWTYGLQKWDIAAGSLLVTEAGGLLSEPNGKAQYLETGNILCANPKLYHSMREVAFA